MAPIYQDYWIEHADGVATLRVGNTYLGRIESFWESPDGSRGVILGGRRVTFRIGIIDPQPMTDRDRFESTLDVDPEDWVQRLVYADFLEEQGEYEAAEGQRWQATKRRHPERMSGSFFWWHPRFRPVGPGNISRTLMGALGFHAASFACYPTRRDAEAALAQALGKVRASQQRGNQCG